MKVTVCELRNNPGSSEQDWQALVAHVQSEASDFILLPEMPFYPWVAETDQADPAVWEASVLAHDRWMGRLVDLAPATVAGSRPVIRQGKQLNEGFVWSASSGYRAVHHKYYLPNEEGFWEATWYNRGDGNFSLLETGKMRVGFMICTELWFNFHARAYAKGGIDLLLCPRATPAPTVSKWIAGGRTAAVVSGAFCLSSNHGGESENVKWGGGSWVIEPQEGELLGVTSQEDPFLTVEINLNVAKAAKRTYPRYVRD